jgi:hypothetical protein
MECLRPGEKGSGAGLSEAIFLLAARALSNQQPAPNGANTSPAEDCTGRARLLCNARHCEFQIRQTWFISAGLRSLPKR